jgi:SRSO17 transposase
VSALVEAATTACSVFVKTTELAAVAAAHSVDADRWQTEFSAVIDRIAPRFRRYEPLRHAAELMAGMVSGLDHKNCWTIAEHRGDATPDGLQHLLSRASWDAEEIRDDLRDYVIEVFGDPGAILVVDETGDVKKGVHSVGVQRQYSGTAGRIENSQVAVYLTYAAPRGHALIDRALYLPRSWAEDHTRCANAGIPDDQQGFATKPTLAAELIDRTVAAQVPAAWVAGDEVYGADPRLRAAIRGHGLGYVMAIAANRRVPTPAGPIRVDAFPAQLRRRAWQKHSAGTGAHGLRMYSWAWIALQAEDDTDTGSHHLLTVATMPLASWPTCAATARSRCRYAPWSPWPVNAGASRSPFKPPKASSRQRPRRPGSTPGPALEILASLDHPGHARPCIPGRGHRDRTRDPTHAYRSDHVDCQRVSTSFRRATADHPPHHNDPTGLVTMAPKTPIPRPPMPLPTTPTSMIPIYGCSTKYRRKTWARAKASAPWETSNQGTSHLDIEE